MPYIKQEDRHKFLEIEHALDRVEIDSSGELNYLFTLISLAYLGKKGLRYQYLNDISGALTNCNLELYRRVAADYENQKISENGDVYDS